MRFLVLQHAACEHPGVFRRFMAEDGVRWDAVELDAGAKIPALDRYDALMVMGGPMDVWDQDKYPWLEAEKDAIRRAVTQLKLPYLGLCLGHQLLADALGGKCDWAKRPEIGLLEVEMTEAAALDPVFRSQPRRARALQWHSVEVVRPPDDAVVLARSTDCAIQAMRVGDRAWGLQYHLEAEPDTVPQWGAIPEYAAALAKSLGADALPTLRASVATALPEMTAGARALYDAFVGELRRLKG